MQKYILREYGKIQIGEPKDADFQANVLKVPAKTFKSLENFAKSQDDKVQELGRIFKFGRDYLRVQNFVGVIETSDGTQIEILPKIYQIDEESETRKIFLNMLRHLQDSPFLQLNEAHLHATDFPILEVFITAFIEELGILVKKGIRKNYLTEEENQPFLKGKLLVNEQIRHNFTHAERFYVRYDDFQANIAPNRLIKSTLHLLFKIARKLTNQISIQQHLLIFEEIRHSENLIKDFADTEKLNRNFAHYQKAMTWCRFFLKQESFTNFSGEAVNFAILFPMERIFEDFVGVKIKNFMQSDNWEVRLQDKKHHLIHSPQKFRLIPDMVLRKKNEVKIILDTKWKIIDQGAENENFKILQSDLYQMFAYAKKYD